MARKRGWYRGWKREVARLSGFKVVFSGGWYRVHGMECGLLYGEYASLEAAKKAIKEKFSKEAS